MIPARRGTKARFQRDDGYTSEDVVAWSDEGVPLVVGQRGLIPAGQYGNFHDIVEPGHMDGLTETVQILPSGGWMERYTWVNDSGTKVYEDAPLVAWALSAGGEVTPLTWSGDVGVDKAVGDSLIWHPDSTGPAPVPAGSIPHVPKS